MQENIIQPQEQVEPVQQNTGKKVSKFIFIATISIFAVSSLSAILGSLLLKTSVFRAGVYLWYIAAGASVIFPILFLLWGAVTFKKGGSSLMGFAVLFFVVALVVGAGTCFVNMSGMHF